MANTCKNPECGIKFEPRYKTTEQYCSYGCAAATQGTKKQKLNPIKRVSKKRGVEERKYSKARREYLARPENQICFIPYCGKPATTIEHRKGRTGYADDWARENDTPLLLDQRYWAPCCLAHNLELESNPDLSKAHQLSKIHKGKKI